MAYGLENIAILCAKGATFRCILWGVSRNEGLRRLNNSVFEDWGVKYLSNLFLKKIINCIQTFFRQNVVCKRNVKIDI